MSTYLSLHYPILSILSLSVVCHAYTADWNFKSGRVFLALWLWANSCVLPFTWHLAFSMWRSDDLNRSQLRPTFQNPWPRPFRDRASVTFHNSHLSGDEVMVKVMWDHEVTWRKAARPWQWAASLRLRKWGIFFVLLLVKTLWMRRWNWRETLRIGVKHWEWREAAEVSGGWSPVTFHIQYGNAAFFLCAFCQNVNDEKVKGTWKWRRAWTWAQMVRLRESEKVKCVAMVGWVCSPYLPHKECNCNS